MIPTQVPSVLSLSKRERQGPLATTRQRGDWWSAPTGLNAARCSAEAATNGRRAFLDPLYVTNLSPRCVDPCLYLSTAPARGHAIGVGVGIAQGYATLGQIGFEGRSDYTAIGTVTNLAARLCDVAEDGQILVTRRIAAATESAARFETLGEIALKGLVRPVAVANVVSLFA